MRRLLNQNGIPIIHPKEFKKFFCNRCGAEFDSDEYKVEVRDKDKIQKLTDYCITCGEECIIIENIVEN